MLFARYEYVIALKRIFGEKESEVGNDENVFFCFGNAGFLQYLLYNLKLCYCCVVAPQRDRKFMRMCLWF